MGVASSASHSNALVLSESLHLREGRERGREGERESAGRGGEEKRERTSRGRQGRGGGGGEGKRDELLTLTCQA